MSDARITSEMRECARRILKALPADDDLQRLYVDVVSLAGDVDDAVEFAEEEAIVERIMEPEEDVETVTTAGDVSRLTPAAIVERIHEHGIGLRAIGKALDGADHGDQDLVGIMLERARAAASFLWAVEMGSADHPEQWDDLTHGRARALYQLSLLTVAALTAVNSPNWRPAPNMDPAWYWCRGAAMDLGGELLEWADKHGEEVSDA